MPGSQWCVFTIGTFGIVRYLHIDVGLRRCSFRQTRQFSGASESEASDRIGLHVFFCIYGYKESIAHNTIIFMKKKKMYAYESPQVEVIAVEVEKGFAASMGLEGFDPEEEL